MKFIISHELKILRYIVSMLPIASISKLMSEVFFHVSFLKNYNSFKILVDN